MTPMPSKIMLSMHFGFWLNLRVLVRHLTTETG